MAGIRMSFYIHKDLPPNTKYQWHFVLATLMLLRMNGLHYHPLQYPWFLAVFRCSWILCCIVRNVTIIIIDTQNSSISIHLYSWSAPTVHIHRLNRPRSLQLLATVAVCNIVELHLSLALQTRMTNPSRSTLKALRKAPGAAWRPPWPSPGCFLITL